MIHGRTSKEIKEAENTGNKIYFEQNVFLLYSFLQLK